MQISNPFWSYPSVRVRFDDDPKKTMVIGSQKVIEAPEGAKVAVLQPIDGGRSDSEGIAEPAVWTPDFGVMSMAAYEERVKISEELAKLEKEKKAAAERKAKEARERSKPVVSEKPARVIDEKLDMGKKLEL